MPTIAIDTLGGASAPRAPVEAAARVTRATGIQVVLVGDPARVEAELGRVSYNPERLTIEATAPNPVESIAAAVELVVSGRADALVTAGAPPTALRACIGRFRLLPGVHRAPLAAVYPTAPRDGNRDPFALILDVGATLRPSAQDLVDWARMGVSYASRISRVEAPTVGLLSTGPEMEAGTPEVREAHRILAADTTIRFVGNVQGLDVPRGAADVVVCDGFTGQVVVQLLGGVGDTLLQLARGAWERRLSWRMGLRLLEGAVVRFHELVSHESYGGAPLLGFEQMAILALPESPAETLANAIKLAAKSVREDVPGVILQALKGEGS